MSKSSARSVIRLRGVRHNNLKNFDLDLPLNRLIVVTGVSGSGKSSLAFDTLFAEGQRRYIETFSPYARQFLDRMDKPQVDSIEGIPPAIAIEQRNSVRTTRSTVGTMTEICDYMKLLWPHVAQLHCRQCCKPVRKDSPQDIWSRFSHDASTPESKERQPPNASSDLLITFDVPLSDKLSLAESIALIGKQGYQRLLIEGHTVRLDEVAGKQCSGDAKNSTASKLCLSVVQDRLKPISSARARFIEACEQAYHFGKGKLCIYTVGPKSEVQEPGIRFSDRLHCASCDIEYREPSPALFSFNHPLGACPACRGFGRIISIDYNLAMPDWSKTLAEGVVKPWQSGQSAECQRDLMRACRHYEVPTDVPFERLRKKWQDFVINGDPEYGKDEEHQWPRAWYGVKGYFRWLESKSYKMHVRVLLSRYRAYTRCPTCQGARFQPESLLFRVDTSAEASDPAAPSAGHRSGSLTLADFYQLPIRRAVAWIKQIAAQSRSAKNAPLTLILNEICARLGYLDEVGLGYLTLDRPTRSLSGGETERVSLTTCLGSRLVNTLFVLDEPSVGLHPRDTARLVRILEQLRDCGNTVVVVEHEASVMRAADQIVDLGPGHGATGGEVVFQGSYQEILKCDHSLTGQYLGGKREISTSPRRPVSAASGQMPPCADYDVKSSSLVLNEDPFISTQPQTRGSWRTGKSAVPTERGLSCPQQLAENNAFLELSGARLHNLKNLSIRIPLGRLVCVTGVSGSGKTTLIREVLLPALAEHLGTDTGTIKASARLNEDSQQQGEDEDSSDEGGATSVQIEGYESLGRVVLVDQTTLGKTPRSNPAVYTGAFDDIRELFAQSDLAKRRGLNTSSFSFNSAQGQCERCRGAGFEKIEMQFLSDVYIRCPDCDGRRYRSHILDIKVAAPRISGDHTKPRSPAISIADLLDATVDEAIQFLECFSESRSARRATQSLKLLQEIGLGYLKLGQPINTLSGGESQRLKLVKYLAESAAAIDNSSVADTSDRANPQFVPTLFLFDEPTTGLHFDDVRVLLKVFHRLVDAGHSVVVIEHNLDVIQSSDWVIDLGPDAGDLGGNLVAEGTPEQIKHCEESHTGRALRGQFGELTAPPRSTDYPVRSDEQTSQRQPHWNRTAAPQ